MDMVVRRIEGEVFGLFWGGTELFRGSFADATRHLAGYQANPYYNAAEEQAVMEQIASEQAAERMVERWFEEGQGHPLYDFEREAQEEARRRW